MELEKLRQTTQAYSEVINQSVSASGDRPFDAAATNRARHDMIFESTMGAGTSTNVSMSNNNSNIGSARGSADFSQRNSLSRPPPPLQETLARNSLDGDFRTIRSAPSASATDMAAEATRMLPPIPAFESLQNDVHAAVVHSYRPEVSLAASSSGTSVPHSQPHQQPLPNCEPRRSYSEPTTGRHLAPDDHQQDYPVWRDSSAQHGTDQDKELSPRPSTSINFSSSSYDSYERGSSGAGQRTQQSQKTKHNAENDDFLAYIENFQREVRGLQGGTPGKGSESGNNSDN